MPGWNECSMYEAECRNKTCSHQTEESLTASVSSQEPMEVQEPLYSLTGLTEADLDLLTHALYVLNDNATVGDDYSKISAMIERLYAAQD